MRAKSRLNNWSDIQYVIATAKLGKLLTERGLADGRRRLDLADGPFAAQQARQDHQPLRLGIDAQLFDHLVRHRRCA